MDRLEGLLVRNFERNPLEAPRVARLVGIFTLRRGTNSQQVIFVILLSIMLRYPSAGARIGPKGYHTSIFFLPLKHKLSIHATFLAPWIP